jgi:hypothetical protein
MEESFPAGNCYSPPSMGFGGGKLFQESFDSREK